MPLLPTRPNSLCLVCTFAHRHQLQRLRLLPRIQVAHRVGGHVKRKKRTTVDIFRTHKSGKSPLGLFRALRRQVDELNEEFVRPEFLKSLQLSRGEFDKQWLTFERSVSLWIKKAPPDLVALATDERKERRSLQTRLRQMFYAQIVGGKFSTAELENQNKVAVLRYPSEWYPATREILRTVHIHVGPTNSGKTYHALQRLEEAKRGIYLGPLRLLAHEVYTRLNSKGKSCALITGEEQRIPEGNQATMFSCTVEMAPLNSQFDVAVIDEIQMINHKERGWAWTQAFLGLQAKEIHLCGEARTVPLMRELCALAGDKLHIHEYQRLTPLKVETRSLKGDLRKLQKGDCIVAFTVLGIHGLRQDIERKTGKKCAIVYGSLPPETRAQQARLFNDPDNEYDFLVASDAIGMGLNLAVKRIIFESTTKSNGTEYLPLQISDLKQIAGRAGRYRTAHEAADNHSAQSSAISTSSDSAIDSDGNDPSKRMREESGPVGWVTTLHQEDHRGLVAGMNSEPEPIKTAGLLPPSLVVERFASYFPPGTPFSHILTRLHEVSETHPRFHLCELKDQLAIADTIHTVRNLSIQDRAVICAAPMRMKFPSERAFLRKLAQCIANGSSGSLLDQEELPLHAMQQSPTRGREYLWRLEQLHKMLVCYLWLSYRFPHVFTTRALAKYTKKLVEDQIEKVLTDFSNTPQAVSRIKKLRAQRLKALDIPAAEAPARPMEHQALSSAQSDEAGSAIRDFHPHELTVFKKDASTRVKNARRGESKSHLAEMSMKSMSEINAIET